MKYLSVLLFLLGTASVFADVTVKLDAGELEGSSSASMIADDTNGSTNGSLLLLVDLGSSDIASPVLTADDYTSGTNFILAAGGFNQNGGTNETITIFDITNQTLTANNDETGDNIALYWFPQITLNEYQDGALPSVGTFFGLYNPEGQNPDGDDAWILPSNGSLIALNFYTTNSDGGGTQLPSEGVADMKVVLAPEPPVCVLFAFGLLFLIGIRRCFSSPQ